MEYLCGLSFCHFVLDTESLIFSFCEGCRIKSGMTVFFISFVILGFDPESWGILNRVQDDQSICLVGLIRNLKGFRSFTIFFSLFEVPQTYLF